MTKNLTVRHPRTTAAIIHLFALAHAAVALASRALNYYDDVPLTILTISMVAIIAIRHRLSLEVTTIVTSSPASSAFWPASTGRWPSGSCCAATCSPRP